MIKAHFTDRELRISELVFDRSCISCRTRNLGAHVSRDTEMKLVGRKEPSPASKSSVQRYVCKGRILPFLVNLSFPKESLKF